MQETWSADFLADVRLSLVKDVGPLTRASLLAAFGSAEGVFSAGRDQLQRVDGVGPLLARRIESAVTEIDVEREVKVAEQHNINLVRIDTDDYPAGLTEISDPPSILYVRGKPEPQDRLAVGIVGTRRASSYGKRVTEQLATGLAKAGVTVVSGLARGIDTIAHQSTLAAGGRTIAVIAGGLLEITPAENHRLADQVAEQGFLLSEAPPRRPPLPGSFPQRNRLISGLSLGVVITEADDRSGALITARLAGEQGRDVFAVPGPIDQRTSRGCHRLIQDGAKLVTCVDDILDELSSLIKPIDTAEGTELRHVAEIKLNDIERKVLDAIETSATQMDDIVENAGLPVHQVLATVSVLEMRRLVRRVSGTQVVRI